MHRRYRAGTWDYDLSDMVHMPGSMTVHENEKDPVFTGLLDRHGAPLYRHPPTVRIGFQKD